MDIPKVTHQSALRIIMSTSFVKFLDARYSKQWGAIDNVTLNKSSLIQLLKEWQKTLRVSAGDSRELNNMKKILLLNMGKKAPETPLDGCYQLQMVITFPWLKGHGKGLKKRCRALRMNKKPDIDNLVKVVADALEKSGCIVNDSRIARMVIEKRYGDDCGIQYKLSPIEQEIVRVEDRPF